MRHNSQRHTTAQAKVVDAREAVRRGLREAAIEGFRYVLLNGDAEQRGVAADGLERCQLADLEDEARLWIAAMRQIAPATHREYLDDPSTVESLARRYYDALPVGEHWRNERIID